MAKGRMDLSAFVGKLLAADEPGVLREGVRVLAQAVMETEVTAQIGAEAYERTGERTAYRNPVSDADVGHAGRTLELAIPKVTPGTCFPSLLEPRRRGERALVAVVRSGRHGVREPAKLLPSAAPVRESCAHRLPKLDLLQQLSYPLRAERRNQTARESSAQVARRGGRGWERSGR